MFPELSQIGRLRRRLGLTQGKLSEISGVSQSSIAKLEMGKLDPSFSNAKKLFEALDNLQRKEGKTAEDIMHRHTYSVRGSQKLGSAVAMMRQNGISQLPVLDSHGKIIGSISEKGVLSRIDEEPDFNIGKSRVSDVMEDAFPTVGGHTPLQTISHILRDSLAVLVMKGNRIEGIITKSDLLGNA
ncbi:MAG: CBS domain-containing protein [Candidatus Micrarchaeota archaeon]